MKSINVHIDTLLSKIQEMSDDNMSNVKLTISDWVIDRNILYPAFLHFEAYGENGSVYDYESIDSNTPFKLPPSSYCGEVEATAN